MPDSRTKSVSRRASALRDRPRVLVAAVAADHVPRRVADDGVEPRRRRGLAVLVEEDFGKRQRPVKEPASRGGRVGRGSAASSTMRSGSAQRPSSSRAVELAKRAAVGRRAVRPEPAGAPEVEETRPASRATTPCACSAASVRSFSRTMAAESSGSHRQPQPDAGSRARRPTTDVSSGNSGSSSWRRPRAAPPPGWRREIVGRRADQAVAGDEVVVEKRQRLVGGERGQPEREPRQLHRHRIEVHAEQTARRDLAPQRRAVGGRDVVRVPRAFLDQRLFGARR